MIQEFYASILSTLFGPVIRLVYIAAVIILPIILARAFWSNWVTYVRAVFLAKQKYILLELRLPKEQLKSPLAMELFITSLYQTGGEGTRYDKYWLGGMRPWFSLELVSIDGRIRFFIWSRERWKSVIESQIYGQYPEIEIAQVNDYASGIYFDPEVINMFACDFKKTAASHIPIKTYLDFGLDKDPKEEFKIDPMTPVIEYLGSLRKGEQVWIQIMIRAHKKERTHPDWAWYNPSTWSNKPVGWEHDAKADIKKRMSRDKKPKEGEFNIAELSMTKGERAVVEAIEHNLSKIAFDVGIRAIYIAKKEVFNPGSLAGMTGSFKQYNSINLNSFAPTNATSVDLPWQDWRGIKVPAMKRMMLGLYKERSIFYDEFLPGGYKQNVFVMTTEELATVYHFPGSVSRTPTFERIGSKKAEPPANLPV
ncbi:MAG: hypothetical protein PHF79_01260 [Candidatus Pacebacteria bacterium]|nr:hypothetical protein [Candidatus Paceibacterota bacterium]